MKKGLLAFAGGLACVIGGPVAAQNADASSGIETIVVTAEKRIERVQDVPASVDVISGDQLLRQNIVTPSDLVRSTPTLNSSGPFGALSVRGVGSVGFSRSSEGSVGIVVDNVALAGTSTNPPPLFDVTRVELLEGPQGTLFGSNSSAGLLNIVTNAPDPSGFETIAHADVGTRENYIGQAVVNIPLSETSALRVSGAFSQQPETQKNIYNGSSIQEQNSGIRARYLWNATSNVTVNIIADYNLSWGDGGAPWAVYYVTPGSPLADGLAACGVHVSEHNDKGCVNDGNKSPVRAFGVSGQIDWALDDGLTLSSITAYRGVRQKTEAYDVDSLPITLFNQTGFFNNDNVSQEFRLTSPVGGVFDYVAGLYYFSTDLKGATTEFGPIGTFLGVSLPLGQTLATTASTSSYAAFGQGNIHVTPKLTINLGLRLNQETVKATTVGTLAPGAAFAVADISGVNASIDQTDLSYKIGAKYAFTDDLMAYASYTRGYKGPAINDQAGGASIPAIVKAEIPNAYEVGVKSTWLDGRLAANVALFYTKVRDFQAQTYDSALAQFVYGNAPSLTSKGVELDLLGNPFEGLTLHAGATYTDAEYGSGFVVACSPAETVAQGCKPIFSGGVLTGTGDDAGGNPLIGAPRWKFTTSSEYEHPLGDNLSGVIQVDTVYTSKVYWSQAYDPLLTVPGAVIVGGRVGLWMDDDKYGLSLFVRNLFNTYRAAVRFTTPASTEELDPRSYAQMSGPDAHRVIGISFDARF